MYSFDKIIGNEQIIKSLKSAILNNRINHAYIFEGTEGIGKKTMANTFAKALNCEKGGAEPCGECVSCATYESGNNPDIIRIALKEGEKEIKIDTVRSLINKTIDIKPYRNKYKIYIIENADKMNVAAQNAFLKTLEEPPSYGVFLLLAENSNGFLTTVLSRCQRYKLKGVSLATIESRLVNTLGISREQARVSALYSEGSIGKAVKVATSEEFNSLREQVIDRNIRLMEADLIGLYKITAEMDEYKERIDIYLDILYLAYRDTLVYKKTGEVNRLIQSDSIDKLKIMADKINTKRLIRGCELIKNAMEYIKRRGDFQLVIENLFFSLKEK